MLVLDGATVTGTHESAAIYCGAGAGYTLNIELTGDNTARDGSADYGVCLENADCVITGEGSVINVGNGAGLTLTDDSESEQQAEHYIILENGRGKEANDSKPASGDSIHVTGGYITGGAGTGNGGGVFVGGSFTMARGTICGNTPKPSAAPDVTLLARLKVTGHGELTLSWTEAKGADGYDAYLAHCEGSRVKRVYSGVSAMGQSCVLDSLKKRVCYRAYVRAWKLKGGKKKYIGKASPVVHAIVSGYDANRTNAEKMTLEASKLKLRVSGKGKIRARLKGSRKHRDILEHEGLLRYYSSDRNVATVSAGGVVKAVGAGKCRIYVIASNGLRKSVKVTVSPARDG